MLEGFSQVTVTHVAASEDDNRVLVVHEEDTQINPIIQREIELWRRIRDYDKKTVMQFTHVLSKKQKQQINKQL